MSAKYTVVGWNRNKLIYDAVLLAMVFIYIFTFLYAAPLMTPEALLVDGPTLRMRAFGTCAFLMLTIILCIGPLARLDSRFLPLLYNRRHFGVLTCVVALSHASSVIAWYFAYSPVDSYVALLSSNTSYGQLHGFPFEILGAAALLILVVLAATSHDFWLGFLTPPVWKALHMAIYIAYGLIVLHVALGPILGGKGVILPLFIGVAATLVGSLHMIAGWRARLQDQNMHRNENGWVFACNVGDIAANCAHVVTLPDQEKVAIFRYGNKLSALSNVCAHQNGPLGEGRIVFGCVTCPWHGFQYRPEDGRAPPPYTEKLATYRLRLDGTRVLLDPEANPPGTYVEPVLVEAS